MRESQNRWFRIGALVLTIGFCISHATSKQHLSNFGPRLVQVSRWEIPGIWIRSCLTQAPKGRPGLSFCEGSQNPMEKPKPFRGGGGGGGGQIQPISKPPTQQLEACRHDWSACIPLVTGGAGWRLQALMSWAAAYGIPAAVGVSNSWGNYVKHVTQVRQASLPATEHVESSNTIHSSMNIHGSVHICDTHSLD